MRILRPRPRLKNECLMALDMHGAKVRFIKRQGARYKPIADYLEIPGFISENEAAALYDLAKSVNSRRPVLVEIGSLLGRSSFILAQGIMAKRNSILYCIDPFVGIEGNRKTSRVVKQAIENLKDSVCQSSYKDQFTENMIKYGAIKRIRVLQGYSYQVVSKFSSQIDLLFIDGNHSFREVRRDFLDWSPFVKPGGHIAIHDVYYSGGEHKGPNQVVQKYLINTPEKDNSTWIQQHLVDCLFIARKAKWTCSSR